MHYELGNAAERALAAKLGDERARALREDGRVYGLRMAMHGCPKT